jgi:hypothetical protein
VKRVSSKTKRDKDEASADGSDTEDATKVKYNDPSTLFMSEHALLYELPIEKKETYDKKESKNGCHSCRLHGLDICFIYCGQDN